MLNKKEYRFDDPNGISDWIDIEICHSGKYGAPGMKREKRKKPTPEQIQKMNQKNKEKKIWRYLRANFRPGDYWITLTYRKGERPSEEEVKKHLAKFRRQLRDAYRKLGEELKYIYSIEIGKLGGIHVHMVLNRIDQSDRIITKYWDHGYTYFVPIYAEGGYRRLAEYIAKAKIYNRSKNLMFPRLRVRRINNREWKRQPRAYKGYYVDKDSIVAGINPVTGREYMHYTMIRFRRD